MKSFLLTLPVALTLASALVVAGSLLATAPATAGRWGGAVAAAPTRFTAMVWSGAALRRRSRWHRQQHPHQHS